MPATPDATRILLEQIGPIRNTHYGITPFYRASDEELHVNALIGGFYDFTSDLSSKDTAYTSESLEPHTDTTYFTDPIVSTPRLCYTRHASSKLTTYCQGLQALHLLSHTDGEGGLSSLVDGFGAAKLLHDTNQEAYSVLSKTPVHAHASGNEGVSIQPMQAYPVLNHSPVKGYLTQVRWNTADRAGIEAPLGPKIDRWYDAAA